MRNSGVLMCWKPPIDNIGQSGQEGIERDCEAEERPLGGVDSSIHNGTEQDHVE